MGLKSDNGCLYKTEQAERYTQTQKEAGHVSTETGGMQPWTPEDGRGRTDPPREPPEGLQPCSTLILDVWAPHRERINPHRFTPVRLQSLALICVHCRPLGPDQRLRAGSTLP